MMFLCPDNTRGCTFQYRSPTHTCPSAACPPARTHACTHARTHARTHEHACTYAQSTHNPRMLARLPSSKPLNHRCWHTRACTHRRTHAWTHTRTHGRTHAQTHARTHAHLPAHVHTFAHPHTQTCACMFQVPPERAVLSCQWIGQVPTRKTAVGQALSCVD